MFSPVFSFSLVSESKGLKYIDNLGINEATCLAGITSPFVKDGSPIIVSPHIIIYHLYRALCLMI